MNCDKCGANIEIESHHIHPKFMDNPIGYGKQYNLCHKHHTILHLIIPSIVWRYVTKDSKTQAIQSVISFSKKYISEKEPSEIQRAFTKKEELLRFCLENGVLLDEASSETLIYQENWKDIVKEAIDSGVHIITIEKLKEFIKNE